MKPILFNTDMVQAILQNRKTVTRRIAFPNGDLQECMSRDNQAGWIFRGRLYENWDFAMKAKQGPMSLCRFRPGDILYVREAWAEMPYGYVYRADTEEPEGWDADDRWNPSIQMPKAAARLFLRVTDVRVERLQDILEDPPGPKNQVVREGFRYTSDFIATWENTIKKSDLDRFSWEANPWIWRITFEKCEKEV